MIKQLDIQMGGRKLTRSSETPPVTARIVNFPGQTATHSNRFTQTDGTQQHSDRPFAF
jgi:hypothetical protein